MEVLAEAAELRGNDLVFPSAAGRRMSDNTLSKLLRDLGIEAVPHGFRSSFRDWCGESGQRRELAEAALAHTIRNKAEAVYARTNLLERRREVMEAWSGYLSGSGADGVMLAIVRLNDDQVLPLCEGGEKCPYGTHHAAGRLQEGCGSPHRAEMVVASRGGWFRTQGKQKELHGSLAVKL